MKMYVPSAIVSTVHCGSPCGRLDDGTAVNARRPSRAASIRIPAVLPAAPPAWPMIPAVCTDETRPDSRVAWRAVPAGLATA